MGVCIMCGLLEKIGKNLVGTNLESSDCMCGYAFVSEQSFVCVCWQETKFTIPFVSIALLTTVSGKACL